MVCSNCGKEIPNNSAYCIFCHAPVGNVEDINVNLDILEDDELIGAFQRSVQKPVETEIKTDEKAPHTKKKVIISLVSFICCLGIVILSGSYLNSYTYIIKKANKAMENGEYESAYRLYEKALTKNSQGLEALVGAGEASKNKGDFNESEKLLKKALDIDGENDTAFASLLDLYDKTDDQEKIAEAEKYANTPSMKETFSEVSVETPIVSLESGEFNDGIAIFLTSKSDLQIYYTIDGKDPSKGEGTLYEGEILIAAEGSFDLKACCYKDGKFSKVVTKTYVIEFETPSLPLVSPMTGSFNEETFVTIYSDMADATIYYTWDGSDPTESSSKYKEPLAIPEGNNVLSVIVVSKNGKYSEVLRVNYTYLPGEEESESISDEVNRGENEYDETDETGESASYGESNDFDDTSEFDNTSVFNETQINQESEETIYEDE